MMLKFFESIFMTGFVRKNVSVRNHGRKSVERRIKDMKTKGFILGIILLGVVAV
jgi:hypothetical protein